MPHLTAHTIAAGGTGHVTLNGTLTGDGKPSATQPLIVPVRHDTAFDAVGMDTRVDVVKAVDVVVPGVEPHTTGLILTVRTADAAEQLVAALLRAGELLRERMSPAESFEETGDHAVPRLPAEPFPAVRVPMPVDVEEPPSVRPATHTREEWDAAIADAQRRAAESFLGYAFLEPRSLYGDHAPFPIYSVELAADLDARAAAVDAT